MKAVVTGGTGFVGRALVNTLTQAGYKVTVLTRRPSVASSQPGTGVTLLQWPDGTDWRRAVAEADIVINLAGEPIAGGRWTPAVKERIRTSRIEGTRRIVDAIGPAAKKPQVLINASAVGYYPPVSTPMDEHAAPGTDFLATLVQEWEREARRAEELGVRVVMLRLGVVLGEKGGALERMALPFKLFVGGPIGSGSQPFPWIHRDDVTGLMMWAIANSEVRGPVNAVAPELVNNAQFSKALGRAMGRPCWMPVPPFALRLVFGEMADMLTEGQAVVPATAERLGYPWRFAKLDEALRDVVAKG